MRWVGLTVWSLVIVGCTGSSTPATTPTSVATTTSTTTTTLEVTTTVDRLTEIEAIYQDLDKRRFEALYQGDIEAFSALFASNAYLEVSLTAFDVMEFDAPPQVEVMVIEVVADDGQCLAAWVQGTVDGIEAKKVLIVLQPSASGWGYAFGGEGWLCDGPHPLES
jgi:hypothetical protein